MTEKINVYSGPYHWYMPAFFDYMHRAPLAALFERAPADCRVLDLGAGDARLTHFLARRFKMVIGLESQLSAIQLGRLMTTLNGSRPTFLQGDAAHLAFGDKAFDVVTAFDVIEHLPRHLTSKMLDEARRVLRPGGWLLLTTPNARSLRNRVLGHTLDPKHYFEFDADGLVRAVADASFDVTSLEGCYIPPPVPRIEHFASVFPFRAAFRVLVRAGRHCPAIAEKLVLLARRPQEATSC